MRVLLTLLLWSIAAPAYAVCTFPDGVEGEIVYNTTHKVAQFCNGTHWISMAPGTAPANDPRIGMLDNGKWCTSDGASVNCTQDAPEVGLAEAAGDAGQLQFNDGADGLNADLSLHWDNTNKRLGIGTATPAEKLDLVGGNIKMGYTQISNSCPSTADCVVTCPSGKYVTGGGCWLISTWAPMQHEPLGSNAWHCMSNGSAVRVTAICANIR